MVYPCTYAHGMDFVFGHSTWTMDGWMDGWMDGLSMTFYYSNFVLNIINNNDDVFFFTYLYIMTIMLWIKIQLFMSYLASQDIKVMEKT